MVKQRYLVHFAYIGTKFRGVQSQPKEVLPENTETIQNDALRVLHPRNDFKARLSSRTDKRVHALHNTLHVELEHPIPSQTYQPQVITECVNEVFRRDDHDIKFLKTQMVPETFHARHSVICRTYRYRFAVISGSNGENYQYLNEIPSTFPLFQKYRCHSMPAPVNLEKMLEAVELFKGVHDMATFTTKSGAADAPTTIRDIKMFEIHPVTGMMQMPDPLLEKENINVWDFVIQSRSFLYHQVRRMAGAVLSVGKDIITLDDIRYMLANPDSGNWNHNLIKPRPDALYLTKVEYNSKDLELGTNSDPVDSDGPSEDDDDDVN